MGYPRSKLVNAHAAGYYHCVSRCVRRAWLCGSDALTGRSFEHRRTWIETRIHELAELFAVAVYGYAVMSNHCHVVLQVDPEVAESWSDAEVAERWCKLFPTKPEGGSSRTRIERMQANIERIAECRRRLASLSWFMRCLNEPIARRANQEDGCSGRFWEGRFRCQVLLDERAVLAAMTYVDLNPIRAGIAQRLDRSEFTSVAWRIETLRRRTEDATTPLRPVCGSCRSSLSLSQADYISLAEWTGRQVRQDKKGAINETEPPTLKRLGIDPADWSLRLRSIGSRNWRAVGTFHQLLEQAQVMGQHWLKGMGLARRTATA